MKYYLVSEEDLNSLRERAKFTQDIWFFKWGPALVKRIENNPLCAVTRAGITALREFFLGKTPEDSMK